MCQLQFICISHGATECDLRARKKPDLVVHVQFLFPLLKLLSEWILSALVTETELEQL